MKLEQNAISEKIVELNSNLGKLSSQENEQSLDIQDKSKHMTKQAQRIISNAFAKYYYVGLTRGFEKWREHKDFENHKALLFKRMSSRLQKNQLYFMKSCFKNWMLQADI
jgi:hypothetical protein